MGEQLSPAENNGQPKSIGVLDVLDPTRELYGASAIRQGPGDETSGGNTPGGMPDQMHPREKGYGIWAEAMGPTVAKPLGEK